MFPAIPAWECSGIKAQEQELICVGEYDVVDRQTDENGITTARFEDRGPIHRTAARPQA